MLRDVRCYPRAVAILLVAAAALPATTAVAAAPKTVALFLITKDDPDPVLVGQMDRDLEELTRTVGTVQLVHRQELQQRLGARPPAALKACGADIGCIAKLGARAKASEVVVLRIVPGAPGIRAQFVRIGVHERVMLGRVELEVSSVDELDGRLYSNFGPIFDVPPPDETAVADAGPAAAAGAADEAEPEVELPAMPALELTALPPSESEPVTTADIVLYSGIAVAGVGAILAGVGAAIGGNGASIAGSITDQTPLSDAVRWESDANAQYDMANGFFGAGAGLAAVGGTLIILGLVEPDFLRSDGDKPSVTVTPAPNGAGATLRLPF